MQGGEHAVLDTEFLVDDLDDGGDAVGGATCVGDDVIDGGVVEVVVDSHDDVEDVVFDGGGDDDFFDSGVEVGLQGGGVAEGARAFEDDVDAGPVDLGGVVLGGEGELLTVDDDVLLIVRDVVSPATVDGVELEEVGGALGGGVGVVDADELEVGIVESSAEDETTDAAESIDSDFHRDVRKGFGYYR